MLFTAFPLRVRGGFLERCDREQAVLSLIDVMVRTPQGSWSGCRRFGLREYFEQARMRPGLPQAAVHEANLALEELGITDVRIQAIETDGGDSYSVTLSHEA